MSRGFTLIELLIITSIIIILATIGLVSYTSVVPKARDSDRKSDLRSITLALKFYHSTNQRYPGTLGQWYGSTTNPNDFWISGLTATQIEKLPNDPTGNGGSPWLSGGNFGYAYCSPDSTGCGGLY